jgi:hypothetical protein
MYTTSDDGDIVFCSGLALNVSRVEEFGYSSALGSTGFGM